MTLDIKTIKMAKGANYAALTTLFENGSPQTHVMWVDTDGEHILINTEIHRVKYKNIQKDPRVNVMIWKSDNAFKFVEIRGLNFDAVQSSRFVQHIVLLFVRCLNELFANHLFTEIPFVQFFLSNCFVQLLQLI